MRVGKRSGFAFFLIILGVIMVMDRVGLGHLAGHLFGLMMPLAMLMIGYIGFQSGRRIIGAVVMFIGIMLLLGHLSGLFGLIMAILLICFGVSMLQKKNTYE